MIRSLVPYLERLEPEEWHQTIVSQTFLDDVDISIALSCRVVTQRCDDHDESIAETLLINLRIIHALYHRLIRFLESESIQPSILSDLSASMFHPSRIVPFCVTFGQSHPNDISSLLNASMSYLPSFTIDLKTVVVVYVTHLHDLHRAISQEHRGQIVELLYSLYETSLSLRSLATCPATRTIVFGHCGEVAVGQSSILRALTVTYDGDIAALQRNLSHLGDKVQSRMALLIPNTRRLLLEILGIVMSHFMTLDDKGESLLTTLHELSQCSDSNPIEMGSYISDLWYLCGYEQLLMQYFEASGMDRENISYWEVIVEGLPKRMVVEEEFKSTLKTDHETESQPTPEYKVDSVDIALISQVTELFPELGDGYVALCLLSTHNQVEQAVSFLLENNPPPVLLEIRHDLQLHDTDYLSFQSKVLGIPVSTDQSPSEIVDPSRIWVGKRAQEKQYDPQVSRKDPRLVEKVKEMADTYADEENWREAMTKAMSTVSLESHAVKKRDEYDDDYNDEFDEYEAFSVHDNGQVEDYDAIREQNRRIRVLEEETAYWESMRNPNHRTIDVVDHEEEKTPIELGDANPSKTTPSLGQRARNTKNKAKVGNHNRKNQALRKRG